MKETIYKHSTPVQIRFNDIDGLGHVNNTIIQEYFDLGRMYYMTEVLGKTIFANEETLIVVNINTDFLTPIYLKDTIEVKTAIVGLGTKSLKMEQQVVCNATQTVKATCSSVMVGFNKTTEEGLELLPEWRKTISQYEGKDF
ncbi:acyl-CoA thioesterase [Carboxylicivirga sediminis]|uniref:Acyl-CoA thioesterase n=1 Tax=Carboxylicivirga sediminis TaxID=2006564 RepID=A0A941F258_9BACT|nr:acyl-CoA thioesterase [Carboxylicivirga sediminis]MBR8534758.1 acyl-CoA thioesterase [Carboxylicivirga sediminis]